MALVFFDGGGLSYNTASERWTFVNNVGGTVQADTGTNGRWGGRCLQLQSGAGVNQFAVGVSVAALDTYVVQVAYNLTAITGSMVFPLVSFWEGTTLHLDIRFNITNNAFTVTRNGTVLGTSSNNAFSTSAGWRYCRVKVVIDDAAGAVTFDQDGVSIFALTSQDTQNGGTGVIDRIYFGAVQSTAGSSTAALRIQDAAICDTTGSAPMNDLHSEGRVHLLTPNGEGDTNDWTPSTGADNAALVDEIPQNGNTDYVSTATTNAVDLYTLTDLPSTPTTIYGVMAHSMVAKDDAGTDDAAVIVKTGGTVYVGSSVPITGSTFVDVDDIWEQNPNTAAAWTASDVNGLQSGIKKVT